MEIGTISLAAIFLSVVGIYAAHLLAKRRTNSERFNRAFQSFSDAFTDEIQSLIQGNGDAYEILKPAFAKHEKAMIEFSRFLKRKNLLQFKESWYEYYCHSKENPIPFPEQYFAAGSITLAKEKRELALKRIRKLLSFAKNVG